MLPSKDLQYSIDRQFFKEGFVFHGISRPVIRKVNNEYCIACFVTMFNMQGFADGLFDRPDYWVAADIADGTVKMIYQCREYGEDFCESVFARRYDLRSLSPAPLSPKYYEKAFAMLDDVRKELLESGTFNTGLYNLYMKRILAECPLPYRKFFRSLSITISVEGKEKRAVFTDECRMTIPFHNANAFGRRRFNLILM